MAEGSWWQRYTALLEFVALTIVWPAGVYAAMWWFLDWSTYGCHTEHPDMLVGLAISGMIAWAWRNH